MATKKKESLDYKQIIEGIHAKNYFTVYGIDGDEPFYIDKIVAAIEHNVLTEAEKDFNLTVFYGGDAKWVDIVSACRRYPMFADRQVVILKEAQLMKDIAKLEVYLENPTPTTIFLIACKDKKIDGRTKLVTYIKKHGIYLSTEALKDYQITPWIANLLKEKKVIAQANVLETLAIYLGNDLQKIVNELDKIFLNEPQLKEITTAHVEKYIGISREYNVFELPNAIAKGEVDKTFRMLNYFIANPKAAPLILLTASLFNNFQKLYNYHFVSNRSDGEIASALKISPYFVKDYAVMSKRYNIAKTEQAIILLKEFNLKTLGFNNTVSDAGLLKELVTNLFYL